MAMKKTTAATKFLTPSELVARWENSVTVGALANWRSAGRGPEYIKLGSRVVYPLASVLEYEQQNRRTTNDSKTAKKLENKDENKN